MSVQLREPIEGDFELVLPMFLDPASDAMAMVHPRTRADFEKQWNQRTTNPACLLRTILCDGEVVGRVNSFQVGDEVHVGYRVARSHWGRGVMGEALRQFLGLIEHRPLIARAAKSNVGSCRVLEKCGFVCVAEYDADEDDHGSACVEVRYELG
jgi:RimJ/RimL family protein N-acetyltransferase